MRKYRKPSGRLLQLWKMEKDLARQGQYSKAQEIHDQAEQLSKQETEQAQITLNSDYQQGLSELHTRNKQEIEKLLAEREHLKQILLSKQAQEKEAMANRVSVLEKKKVFTQKENPTGLFTSSQKIVGRRNETCLPKLVSPVKSTS